MTLSKLHNWMIPGTNDTYLYEDKFVFEDFFQHRSPNVNN